MGRCRIKENRSAETGANLVEYLLLLTLMVFVVIVGVRLIGPKVSTQFSNAAGQL